MLYNAHEGKALNLSLVYPTLSDMANCVTEPSRICLCYHFAICNKQVSIQYCQGKYYVSALGYHPEYAPTAENYKTWHRISNYEKFYTDCLPYFYRVVRDMIAINERSAIPFLSNAISVEEYNHVLF